MITQSISILEFEWEREDETAIIALLEHSPPDPGAAPIFNPSTGNLVDPGYPSSPGEIVWEAINLQGDDITPYLSDSERDLIEREIYSQLEAPEP